MSSAAGSGFDGAALPSPLPAPDFTLRDQSGGTVALHSLRGSPVVLAFLYPGCGAELRADRRADPRRAR